MNNLYSDGQGTFLSFKKNTDDDNFTDIIIEEEQENNSYTDIAISLHNDIILNLGQELTSHAHKSSPENKETTEYIITIEYFPIVVEKNELFKIKTGLTKEELHSRILEDRISKNEWFEVNVIAETINEYLEYIPTKDI